MERELVFALRRGDPAAWGEVVHRYVRLVAHVIRQTLGAYRRLVPEHDVEDLVYELLAGLVKDNYRVLAQLGEPYDLKGYLAVAARRKAVDYLRRPPPPLSLDQAPRDAEPPWAEHLPALAPAEPTEPDEVRLDSPEAWKTFEAAYRRLAPRERLLVKLFYLKRLKYREIARLTGIPQNSIGPTLARAVEKLRAEIANAKPGGRS